MTNTYNHRASERIRLDLVKATSIMPFGLVDDVLEEFHDGNLLFAQRALRDAARALTDIDERLHQLDAVRSAPFGPLVDELRRAIRSAEAARA
jgi:hypothetical protein